MIPGRVAGQWGHPDIALEVGELENVLLCSDRSLRRVRRKLAIEGEGAVYVRLERNAPPTTATEASGTTESKEEKEEDEGLEGWLAAWDEMPEGCAVLAGLEKEGWSNWDIVKYVISCHSPSTSADEIDFRPQHLLADG
jgi:hypothetical protein